ncbi:hypothetical protein QAD02_011772 [Eretmocerus hayati]|uniref:Uncharacterized protein n=1 Tax=Eretmocerus hayati TaxID=131215 RepID=A0ACC2NZG7_9HYME|nr:hypothetical protein QAD02_011772 [Eretmocerus hayati]
MNGQVLSIKNYHALPSPATELSGMENQRTMVYELNAPAVKKHHQQNLPSIPVPASTKDCKASGNTITTFQSGIIRISESVQMIPSANPQLSCTKKFGDDAENVDPKVQHNKVPQKQCQHTSRNSDSCPAGVN